jgi:predicted Co/Zn/Cd cation transporter (cation efflux family)
MRIIMIAAIVLIIVTVAAAMWFKPRRSRRDSDNHFIDITGD